MNRFYFSRVSQLIMLFVLLIIGLGFTAKKADADQVYTAATTSNLEVNIKELELMLHPLTNAELKIEAAAWQGQLQQVARQLSQSEILAHRLEVKEAAEAEKKAAEAEKKAAEAEKKAAEADEEVAEAGEEVAEADKEVAEADKEVAEADKGIAEAVKKATEAGLDQKIKSEKAKSFKDELLEEIAAMKMAQAAVAKRMEVVLSELEKKGGDTKELRLYTDAFSGIEIDVSNTESAWLALEAWVTSDEGGLSMLVSIVKFVVAMIFVILLANLTGKIADRFTKISNVSSLLKSFIKVFARRIVLFIGFIASVSILGINIGPVLALIGAAGLVIGLALQNTLGNFASGILILLYRPFDMGDVVEVDGFTGTVNSMTLLSTSIKTFDNKFIVIPNNSVWNAAITNVTGSKTRRVDMVFGIGYDDDFTTAQKIIQTVLDDHPKVLNEPKPIVRMNELGDSSVNIICRPWTKTEDYWDVYWDVMEAVKYEFDTQGVTFPFPQQDVHLFPAK